MDPEEHAKRIKHAMEPHWPASKPWPKDGPIADRLLLADCAGDGNHDDEAEEMFTLAREGTDQEVGERAAMLRSSPGRDRPATT